MSRVRPADEQTVETRLANLEEVYGPLANHFNQAATAFNHNFKIVKVIENRARLYSRELRKAEKITRHLSRENKQLKQYIRCSRAEILDIRRTQISDRIAVNYRLNRIENEISSVCYRMHNLRLSE